MIWARVVGIDAAGAVVTAREKKRVTGWLTARSAPLSSELATVSKDWIESRPRNSVLFGPEAGPISPEGAQKAFVRVFKGSKWAALKGWNVCRYSFISARSSRGVDRRIIDDFVSHQTDEQPGRYRHLDPSTEQEAIRSVFG
jgi:hypothetical protein